MVIKFGSMFNLVTIPKDIFKFNTFIFCMDLFYCVFASRAQKGNVKFGLVHLKIFRSLKMDKK